MHKLEKIIRDGQEQGRQALIPFVTAGFPDRKKFWEIIIDLDRSGADIIEIGVPFSDPVADGPVVEAASTRALGQGVCPGEILEGLARHRDSLACGIVLMGYYNPFLQYGLEKFAKDAKQAGVDGLIVPDLPLDEAGPMRVALDREDIALIPLLGPNTPLARMKEYAERSRGYAYVVSVMGITGERKALPPGLVDTMKRAREAFSLPLALGFGLGRPEQLEVLPPEAMPDAVIFGSALLVHLGAGKPAVKFMERWTGQKKV